MSIILTWTDLILFVGVIVTLCLMFLGYEQRKDCYGIEGVLRFLCASVCAFAFVAAYFAAKYFGAP